MFEANRVQAAISTIDRRLSCFLAENRDASGKPFGPAELARLGSSLDMAFDEYATFQELKSIAAASGKLSPAEAQTIYGYLGETLEHFNGQPPAVKVILTKICTELLSAKIAGQQSRRPASAMIA